MIETAEKRLRKARKAFQAQKVATVDRLARMLGCSIPTVRRRLKQWDAHTSYNNNGRYYALPEVVRFDAEGLWRYRGIGFSRYGNLPQTVVGLVQRSPAGLDGGELGRLVGLEPRSFLSSFRTHPGLRREKIHRRFVYFSAHERTFAEQKRRREAMDQEAAMPSDAEAILILVETIKDPRLSCEQLAQRLAKRGMRITAPMVRNLFAQHGLEKKTARSPR